MYVSSELELLKRRAWAEIDLDAVRSNVSEALSMLGQDRNLLAVVKADAYGHGILQTSKAAIAGGAKWLGVATAAEGVNLREAGVVAPIALICAPCPTDSEAVAILENNLVPAIGDRFILQALARAAAKLRMPFSAACVHLELDTGCGRSGFLPEEAVEAWRFATEQGLRINGFATHFADADGSEEDFTLEQWNKFARTRRCLESAGASFEWIHAGNSAATLRIPTLDCNLVRPGLLLYGISPTLPGGSPLELKLRPALSLKARVATVRNLPEGHNISYGLTCALARPSRVATVLIGYGDGYPRRLSNLGEMLVQGRRVPILGRVCMDQTMVDVTDLPEVFPGEIATCIGEDGKEKITVEEIARKIGTTDHEITTALTSRLPRVYVPKERE